MSKNPFYITTSIGYANAAPHLGHAYEAFLTDVIARYQRGIGSDVFFLTGTDEHGVKIARTAEKAEKTPQDFVDENAQSFRDFYDTLGVSYDAFIRTSDKVAHWGGAQKLWEKLAESGDIYKSKYTGLYCVGCEAYVTEKDLVDGKCIHHDKAPEQIEEENYFFRLSKYAEVIKGKIERDEIHVLPDGRKNEILALFNDGISDVSFSRPQAQNPWGIPVPNDPTQVMYVWCDALTNYISALGYGREDTSLFAKYWPADVHVIGKDILRFHALLWPAMLISADLALPKQILVHGFITSGGKKMSKSLGNGVDPKEYVENHGSEALRSFFSRDILPFEDSDFTDEKFLESYNANLANGLGNLVSRTLKMANTYFEGKVSAVSLIEVPLKHNSADMTLATYVENEILLEYHLYMKKYELTRATEIIWSLVRKLDGYISEYEPFKLIKTDPEKTEAVLANLLSGILTIADIVAPFLPETSQKIQNLIARVGDTYEVQTLETPLFPRK